jgi:hypothetical protein
MVKRKATTPDAAENATIREETSRAKKRGKVDARNAGEESSSSSSDRCDPAKRGIHPDALRFGTAPTSASACVGCGRTIAGGSVRWGLKYAGNPLPEPVVPLYGSHPMTLWCHADCGLTYHQLREGECAAAKTCHLCQTEPDPERDGGLRLLCGGSNKGRKVRSHAFHLSCWKQAVMRCDDETIRRAILRDPTTIGGRRLGWSDLSAAQQEIVRRAIS